MWLGSCCDTSLNSQRNLSLVFGKWLECYRCQTMWHKHRWTCFVAGFCKNFSAKIYVDDVFRYTNGFKQIERLLNNHSEVNKIRQISASWLKYGPFRDTINNALAYHHLCILSALSQGAEIEQIDVHLNQLNQKSFRARCGTIQMNSEIDRSSSQNLTNFK